MHVIGTEPWPNQIRIMEPGFRQECNSKGMDGILWNLKSDVCRRNTILGEGLGRNSAESSCLVVGGKTVHYLSVLSFKMLNDDIT